MSVNKSMWEVTFGYVRQLAANLNSFTVLADSAETAMEKAKKMLAPTHGEDEAKEMAVSRIVLMGTEDSIED